VVGTHPNPGADKGCRKKGRSRERTGPNQVLHVTGQLRLLVNIESSGPHVNWVDRDNLQ